MKNQVILLFLLFLGQLCPAQSSYYHPLPKSFAGWDESHRGYQTGDCKDYHHWITGDTIFAGILYHKIQTKGKLYWMGDYGCTDIVTSYFNYYSGAYRNDSIHKKVYYLPKYSSQEVLLYDFDLIQNQKLTPTYLYDPTYNYAYVSLIDSVLVGTEYHKRYEVSDTIQNHYADLIEGVGSTLGFLERIVLPFEFWTTMNCFEFNGVAAYPSQTGSCGIYTGGESNSLNVFRISPNPLTDEAQILINTPNQLPDMELNFYDIYGNSCFSSKITNGTILHLNKLRSGIYFYLITDLNSVLSKGKIIKIN